MESTRKGNVYTIIIVRTVLHNYYALHHSGVTLSKGSLWVVLNELLEIKEKWREFGLGLNLRSNQLEAIGSTSSHPLECLYKVVSEWLNRSDPLPTWDALVAVLRTQLVGEKELADTLHEKFCSELSIFPSNAPNRKRGVCMCVHFMCVYTV